MPSQSLRTTSFVLVHGAWHGGWCWSRVADSLQALGNKVYTPTNTGLGERSHLLAADITLQTFVQDIANVLIWEDLDDVILVGHSFGGLAVTGVADLLPQRIRRLVYLDAFILQNGVSVFDILPGAITQKLRASAAERHHGLALPVPRPKTLGLTRPGDTQFVEGRLTPQPLGSYETALHLNHPVGNGLPCSYLHCIAPPFEPTQESWKWARQQAGWDCVDLNTGHDAMVSAPDLVTGHLLDLAG